MHLRITKKKKQKKTIAPYFLIMKKFPFKCLDKMCIKQKIKCRSCVLLYLYNHYTIQ